VASEAELSFKQKQNLIIKRMQSRLLKASSRTVLFKGWILKQGQKANKKVSRRLMLLSPVEIQWFHDQQEVETGAVPLGLIRIEDIYKCSQTVLRENTYDFDISVVSYFKKGQLETQTRTIKFGCETELDRTQWISRIEFLRAKTLYENYVNKFVPVTFPLQKQLDTDEAGEEESQQEQEFQGFARMLKLNAKINRKLLLQSHSSFLKTKTIRPSAARPRKSILTLKTQEQDSVLGRASSSLESPFKKLIEKLSAKQLAENLRTLYTLGKVGFLHQISVNANKASHSNFKNKPLSNLPDPLFSACLKANPQVRQLKPHFASQPRPTSDGSEWRSSQQQTALSMKSPLNCNKINEASENSSSGSIGQAKTSNLRRQSSISHKVILNLHKEPATRSGLQP
jgi:hypothetical protein